MSYSCTARADGFWAPDAVRSESRQSFAEMVRKYDQWGKPDGWKTITARQRRCIQKEVLNLEILMKTGGLAFDTFQRLRRHATISLGNLARLLDQEANKIGQCPNLIGARIVLNPQRLEGSNRLRVGTTRAHARQPGRVHRPDRGQGASWDNSRSVREFEIQIRSYPKRLLRFEVWRGKISDKAQ